MVKMMVRMVKIMVRIVKIMVRIVKIMVRMVKMMRMMLSWRLKQINFLPRHDDGDDDDDDEADYGKDDEDDASLEAERNQFSDICLCIKLPQTNNPKRQKPQTYKHFSSCDASCS